MAKFHVNSETGQYGTCKAKPGNCPVGGEDQHFQNKKDTIQASEKILAEKHGSIASIKKKDRKTTSLRQSLIDDFRQQAIEAKENNDLRSSALFNQFANFANNNHSMNNSQTIEYMSNMLDLENVDDPKNKEIIENIILENSENFKNYNEFKPINLPFEVVEHPKGYEFYKKMENSTTTDEQMKLVRFFDYGDVDRSMIIGKDTEDFTDKLEDKRNEEYSKYLNDEMDESNETKIPYESYFVAIQNENKKYTVWMLDEDGINLGAVHNTEPDNAYEQLREIWANKEEVYKKM